MMNNNTNITSLSHNLLSESSTESKSQNGTSSEAPCATFKKFKVLGVSECNLIDLIINNTYKKNNSQIFFISNKMTSEVLNKEISTSTNDSMLLFVNGYHNKEWQMLNNHKNKNAINIHMSNVVMYQFNLSCKKNINKKIFPNQIRQCKIMNEKTEEVINKYIDKKNTMKDDILKEFLNETVNGKSTIRIAEAFCMRVMDVHVIPRQYGCHYDVVCDVEPDINKIKAILPYLYCISTLKSIIPPY